MLEKSFILSCLLSKSKLPLIMELQKADFETLEAQRCYDIIKYHYDNNIEIDLSLLLIEYGNKYKNTANINDMLSLQPAANAEALKRQIQKKSFDRRIKKEAEQIIKQVQSGVFSAEDLAEKMNKLISEIEIDKDKEIHTRDLSLDIFNDENSKRVKTGILGIDQRTGGLYGGQLVVIAARPGIGKSAVILNMIRKGKHKALLFSLEMMRSEIYARLLSFESGADSRLIETGKLNEEQLAKVKEAHEKLKSELDLVLADKYFGFSELYARIKKECETNKPDVIYIDYLQLITGGGGGNETERLANITRSLKMLAAVYNIPIVLLSQLNRNGQDTDREPIAADLRGSGAIEQDASTIIFLHCSKEEKFKKNKIVKIIIDKARKGGVGFFDTEFYGESITFSEYLKPNV